MTLTDLNAPDDTLVAFHARIEALTRELQHVQEQLRTEHAMTLDWKARALTAEDALQKRQEILRKKAMKA